MNKCNLCGSEDLLLLIDFGNHPVGKHYLARANDDAPVWPVRLCFCESCGLTQLVDACPPEILYQNYVTLSMWKAQPHVQHEIDMLISRPGIDSAAKLIEIGSNDGMFLEQLTLNGFKNCLGIEPTQDAYDASVSKGMNTVRGFLTSRLSLALVEEHGQFDVFVSRQNLEHIADLPSVLRSMEILLKPGGYVLIEVPDFMCNLQNCDYALWEEHVNYFTVDTMRHLLSLADIEIIHEESLPFSGGSFFVIGRKVGGISYDSDYLVGLRGCNLAYAAQWCVFREEIRDFLSGQNQEGKKIAVYGAGGRTFCLLNFAGISPYINVILDDQVEKQNRFMPGGGLPIVASEALYSLGIDICLLAVNAENEEKITDKHRQWSDDGGQFWSILPPSRRLLPVWQYLETNGGD